MLRDESVHASTKIVVGRDVEARVAALWATRVFYFCFEKQA